ncbi:MAG: CAP domain-containing protein [Pseudomonadota bacterium]
MHLRNAAMAAVLMALTACGPAPQIGGTEIYQISARDARQIPFRMEESINALRAARGATPLQISPQLTAAAETHARDMAAQNRPWHFGSDGSSPIDRVLRTGYAGQFLGENISETFETEGETLAAWMEDPATRSVILDPRARAFGFAWHQEGNGKIWWTLVTGA